MKSDLPKVLHPALGRPLIHHVLRHLAPLGPERIVVVVGHGADLVRGALAAHRVRFATQEPQLGTGHAVQTAWSEIESGPEQVLVLAGDMPLVRTETLRRLLAAHASEGNDVTFLSGTAEDPEGYGRVIRGADGGFRKIVEQKDATPEERAVTEVNSGIYVFAREPLREALASLRPENRQKEYYLTDCLTHVRMRGGRVGVVRAEDARELYGVNSADQLQLVERTLQEWGES